MLLFLILFSIFYIHFPNVTQTEIQLYDVIIHKNINLHHNNNFKDFIITYTLNFVYYIIKQKNT